MSCTFWNQSVRVMDDNVHAGGIDIWKGTHNEQKVDAIS